MAFMTITTLALLLLTLTSGCTKPKHAVRQTQVQLPVPNYDTGAQPPFLLAPTGGTLTYQSNLLVWDPAVSADQIQGISDAAVNLRLTSVDLLAYAQGQGIPGFVKAEATAQAQLDKLKALENAQAASEVDVTKAAATTGLADWFAGRIAGLSAADQTAAGDLFPVYCEAKLWELAANPLLGKAFQTRPTPLEICEPYYASATPKLLDKSTPECQDAAPDAPRSYVACLWAQGVVKTSIFAGRAAQPKASQEFCKDGTTPVTTRLAALVASGQLPTEVAKALASEDVTTAYLLWTSEYGTSALPTVFSFAADCPKLLRQLDGGSDNAGWSSNNQLQIGFDPASDGKFSVQSLATIISAVESQITTASSVNNLGNVGYTLLPINCDSTDNNCNAVDVASTAATLGVLSARYELLADDIRALALRYDPQNQPTSLTTLSANDFLFNHPTGAGVYNAPLLDDGDKSGAAVNARPAFAALKTARSAIPSTDYSKPKAVAQSAIDAAARRIAAAKANVQAELNKPNGVDAQKAQAGPGASAPGVAQLLTGFTLTVERAGDVLTTQLQFPGGRLAAGCLALEGGACYVGDKIKAADSLALAFDQSANELVIDLKVDDPRAQKLYFEPTEDVSVDHISEAKLQGTTLHLEAFANKLGGQLDFFTGNAAILDANGNALYKGSISGSAIDSDLIAYGAE